MKIYIASDHAGYEMKKALYEYLKEKDYEVEDMGNQEYDPDDDYPDFILPLAEKVAQDDGSVGIILGLTGSGEAIAANKVKGIRATLCLNNEMAQKAREHNHANILSLAAGFVDIATAKMIVDTFLTTDFSKEERHIRRVKKISSYESAKS